jgi:hypothetical protein
VLPVSVAPGYLVCRMIEAEFDGFSIRLPEGWGELSDEATYSDPTEGDRTMLGRAGGPGALYVSLPTEDPDNPPEASRDHVEALASAWGRARGLAAPVRLGSVVRPDGVLALAEYQLAGEYVAVWYLSNDEITLHASYSCVWSSRREDRGALDSMIASLTFA